MKFCFHFPNKNEISALAWEIFVITKTISNYRPLAIPFYFLSYKHTFFVSECIFRVNPIPNFFYLGKKDKWCSKLPVRGDIWNHEFLSRSLKSIFFINDSVRFYGSKELLFAKFSKALILKI